MGLYSDSKYLIKEEIETVHKDHFLDFAVAGTWGNSEQRIAIASFAREAGISAGLLEETPNTFAQESNFKLSKVAKLVVEKLAISPKDILKDFFDEVINTGLSEEEYVEIVGIVSRIVDMDIFARGIDHPLIAFPEPGVGPPSKVRPETAKLELAWVSTIPNFPEGGLPAKQLFGEKPPKPYIVRGLSLVPDEVTKHMELEKAQYQPLGNIMNFDLRHHKGLSRAQVEVVAGKVSALNECFYWTSSHARFLRESGRVENLEVNLKGLVDSSQDIGVPGGAELLEFSEALIGNDSKRLNNARLDLEKQLGPDAIPAASAIAANFSKNDRIANGCGIPVDEIMLKATIDIREELNLDSFRSAANTFRHLS